MNDIRIKDQSVEQQRIDRIKHLIDRVDRIPEELDEFNERIMRGNLNRKEFDRLVNARNALLIELENKKNELENVYRIWN